MGSKFLEWTRHASISARGKAILFGEHAAVFGYPALAMGIENALRLIKVAPTKKGHRLIIQQWGIDETSESDSSISQALRLAASMLPEKMGGQVVTFQPRIPMGQGLGSSAALSVALVKVYAAMLDEQWPNDWLAEASIEIEKIFHQTPSGIDSVTCAFGGLILFQKNPLALSRWRHEHALAFPNASQAGHWGLKLEVETPNFAVIESGEMRQTKAMVAHVRTQFDAHEKETAALFSRISEISAKGVGALLASDARSLGEAMVRNHEALQALGVSTDALDAIVHCALDNGALGAKLTGAGGGGVVLAYAPGREKQLKEALNDKGYRFFFTDESH